MIFFLKVSLKISILAICGSFFIGIVILILVVYYLYYKKCDVFNNTVDCNTNGIKSTQCMRKSDEKKTTLVEQLSNVAENTLENVTQQQQTCQSICISSSISVVPKKFNADARSLDLRESQDRKFDYTNINSKYLFGIKTDPIFKNYLHKSKRPFLGYVPVVGSNNLATKQNRSVSYY